MAIIADPTEVCLGVLSPNDLSGISFELDQLLAQPSEQYTFDLGQSIPSYLHNSQAPFSETLETPQDHSRVEDFAQSLDPWPEPTTDDLEVDAGFANPIPKSPSALDPYSVYSSSTCPGCGRSFARPDICIRHRRESCSKSKRHKIDNLRYHCPHPLCSRSKLGKGFPRKEHVRQHLNHCEIEKQRQLGTGDSGPAQLIHGTEMHQPRSRSKLKAEGGNVQSTEKRQKLFISPRKTGAKCELEKTYQRLEKRAEELRRDLEEAESYLRALHGVMESAYNIGQE